MPDGIENLYAAGPNLSPHIRYMVERKRFNVGDRVEATPEAWSNGALPRNAHPPVYATVVGRSRDPDSVNIVRDGLKTHEKWHVTFWRLAPAEATERPA